MNTVLLTALLLPAGVFSSRSFFGQTNACERRYYLDHYGHVSNTRRYCKTSDKCGRNEGICMDASVCQSGLICAYDDAKTTRKKDKCCRCPGGQCVAGHCPCSEGEGVCSTSSACKAGLECRLSDPVLTKSPKRCCAVRDQMSYNRRIRPYCTIYCKCGESEEGCSADDQCGNGLTCRAGGRCCHGLGMRGSRCSSKCPCHEWFSCVNGQCQLDKNKVPTPEGQCKTSAGNILEYYQKYEDSAADCKCTVMPGIECRGAIWSTNRGRGVCRKYYQRGGILGRWNPPRDYLPPYSKDPTTGLSSVTYKMECRRYGSKKVVPIIFEDLLEALRW